MPFIFSVWYTVRCETILSCSKPHPRKFKIRPSEIGWVSFHMNCCDHVMLCQPLLFHRWLGSLSFLEKWFPRQSIDPIMFSNFSKGLAKQRTDFKKMQRKCRLALPTRNHFLSNWWGGSIFHFHMALELLFLTEGILSLSPTQWELTVEMVPYEPIYGLQMTFS